MQDKLLQIIKHYGIEKQLKYIHSEYYELDEAIINTEIFTKVYGEISEGDVKHIAEEIADIQVMLEQFRYYYGISYEEIEKIMEEKINRQIERIENENNNN